MACLQIVTFFFAFVSFSLAFVALASNYWIVDIYNNHAGLWQICEQNNCISLGIDALEGYIHATRGFMISGTFAGAVLISSLWASYYHTHIGSRSIKSLAVWASIVAGVCSMMAMTTFTKKYTLESSLIEIQFGWSTIVGWASFPLFLLTGGLAYNSITGTTQS